MRPIKDSEFRNLKKGDTVYFLPTGWEEIDPVEAKVTESVNRASSGARIILLDTLRENLYPKGMRLSAQPIELYLP